MPSRTSGVNMSIYTETGRRIREIRRSAGMSQARLATSVGLSRTSITNIERGRQKILLGTLSQIAGALKVPIQELLPPGGNVRLGLESQLPSDASPKLRRWISTIVDKKS